LDIYTNIILVEINILNLTLRLWITSELPEITTLSLKNLHHLTLHENCLVFTQIK
jgi:hypothetical protein